MLQEAFQGEMAAPAESLRARRRKPNTLRSRSVCCSVSRLRSRSVCCSVSRLAPNTLRSRSVAVRFPGMPSKAKAAFGFARFSSPRVTSVRIVCSVCRLSDVRARRAVCLRPHRSRCSVSSQATSSLANPCRRITLATTHFKTGGLSCRFQHKAATGIASDTEITEHLAVQSGWFPGRELPLSLGLAPAAVTAASTVGHRSSAEHTPSLLLLARRGAGGGGRRGGRGVVEFSRKPAPRGPTPYRR